MSSRLDGLEANYALFASLPDIARDELATAFDAIGSEALGIQQQLAPVYDGEARKGVVPGQLKAALTISQAIGVLRLRVGLPQLRSRSKIFYAVIMEYGRRAQQVTVRRLKQGGRQAWRKLVREGLASARARPAALTGQPYTMQIPALPPRPFVHVDSRLDALVDRYMARFQDAVAAKTESA